jgi:hypothetical protein
MTIRVLEEICSELHFGDSVAICFEQHLHDSVEICSELHLGDLGETCFDPNLGDLVATYSELTILKLLRQVWEAERDWPWQSNFYLLYSHWYRLQSPGRSKNKDRK